MPRISALTGAWPGLVRVLKSEIEICLPVIDLSKPPTLSRQYTAIWDTGASGSVITQRVVDELSLKPISRTVVHTAGGTKTSPVYLVDFVLPDKVLIRGLNVTLGTLIEADALIGMDVITVGDFSITNFKDETTMSFRLPSQGKRDFVKDLEVRRAMDESKRKPSPQAPMNRQQRRQKDREAAKKNKKNR